MKIQEENNNRKNNMLLTGLKPMIHGSTFVEQQMLLLLFNKCVVEC